MDSVGLHQTRVPEPGDDGELQPAEAVSSAEDITTLLRLIATHQGLSDSSLNLLQSLLSHSAPPDALRDTMTDDVSVLDKTGNLADASNVGALLLTPHAQVILVVLDEDVDPGDARAVITQLGQAAYDEYLRVP
jgi:hypothetical protein